MERTSGRISRLTDDQLIELLGDMWLSWRFEDQGVCDSDATWNAVWEELQRRGLVFTWGSWWETRS